MPVNKEKYTQIIGELAAKDVQLVAVSKLQSISDIEKMYDLGQRDFGENYVQELIDKQEKLPKDIRWHFIGHLQRNKVKYIASFIHLVQGVDSYSLLQEINKEAHKANRKIHCLLQMHIAQEETKFGLDEHELDEIIQALINTPALLSHIYADGLMGMASFSDDMKRVSSEMEYLQKMFLKYRMQTGQFSANKIPFTILSMGMSGDYKTAIEHGSNMVRIGSLLFGARTSK